MVIITLYARQQKRHRCIEQSFGFCEFHHRNAGGAAVAVSRDGMMFRDVSMPFSQIIPPFPSPTESKSPF